MTLKLYDIIFDHDTHDPYYRSPNPWKIRLALLQKGLPFETIEVTHIDISTTLTARYGKRATCPALELEDGTLLCDSYHIAEYLEENYPTPHPSSQATPLFPLPAAEITLGKAFSRLVDLGLGDSDPQWAVWLELILPDLIAAAPHAMTDKALERDALLERAKLNILPIAAVLRERPGEFLQGREPGFTDFVVFGRYAMCRNCNPGLAKAGIMEWVERMVERFPEIRGHLRPYDL
ncbi:hypothetical protein BC829DRAFT_408343 [Chytridium lagenaria]|nr:hypothetical protein BC829DRAFT_408343 [Chytridium lagenaria]